MQLNKSGVSVFVLSLFIALLSFSEASAQSQNAIAQWIHGMQSVERSNNFQPVSIFQTSGSEKKIDAVFGETVLLNLQPDIVNVFMEEAPATMEFEIPVPGSMAVVLLLAQVNIISDDFAVGTKDNEGNHPFDYSNAIHYRGIVKGNDQSVATISLFNDELIGMISSEEGTFNLGKMEDESEQYVFYNSSKSNYHPEMNCMTDDSQFEMPEFPAQERGVGCKIVKVYLECDYKMYTDKGSSTTNVVNYVTGLFNQVAALYTNENIETQIQQIYVWTVSDPYVSYASSGAILPVFRANNSPLTIGNLAHFLSTRSLGGGVAYLETLCFTTYSFAVSGIYNSYSNVPTYSWSVEVFTHEMGHNLGSPHTHSCSWAGGPVDNCGPTAGYPSEGGCANGPTPVGGGTIMSYCHLVSAVGINFNNGFGTLPGNLIRNEVINASCLSSSGVVPAGLAASPVGSDNATVSWNAVAGAPLYTIEYRKSSVTTWTSAGTTSSTSINLTGLTSATLYLWHVKTDCSAFSAESSFTTTSVSGCTAPANLTATGITTSSAALNWNAVSGATDYSLQYKLSVTSTWITVSNITGTTYNLSGLYALSTYQWKVKANCSNYTAVVNFSTTGTSCSKPTNLVSTNITGNSANLAWTSVVGAAYYVVYYKTSSVSTYTTWGITTSPSALLQNLSANTTYNWRVRANCSGNTTKKTFITTAGMPEQINENGILNWQIYPNPVTEFVNVSWQVQSTGTMQIELSDVTGRVIFVNNVNDNNQVRINTASLTNGIYFISLKNEDGYTRTGRFIKE